MAGDTQSCCVTVTRVLGRVGEVQSAGAPGNGKTAPGQPKSSQGAPARGVTAKAFGVSALQIDEGQSWQDLPPKPANSRATGMGGLCFPRDTVFLGQHLHPSSTRNSQTCWNPTLRGQNGAKPNGAVPKTTSLRDPAASCKTGWKEQFGKNSLEGTG